VGGGTTPLTGRDMVGTLVGAFAGARVGAGGRGVCVGATGTGVSDGGGDGAVAVGGGGTGVPVATGTSPVAVAGTGGSVSVGAITSAVAVAGSGGKVAVGSKGGRVAWTAATSVGAGGTAWLPPATGVVSGTAGAGPHATSPRSSPAPSTQERKRNGPPGRAATGLVFMPHYTMPGASECCVCYACMFVTPRGTTRRDFSLPAE
jgi:hypothetical protein